MKLNRILFLALMLSVVGISCDDDDDGPMPKDPDNAEEVSVDRFSDDAATLMKRSENPGLPEANEPIDYDQAPFITKGLGPDGQTVEYYNFDVQSTETAPIFVLFREGESTPVEDQLNIIDVIPGEPGYNDFWHVHKVTVPEDYEANVVTSKAEIDEMGFPIEATDILVNCPVVPEGSTADKRFGSGNNGLIRGWYEGMVVYYFAFEEKDLSPTSSGTVPLSPIYVAFNINPDPDDPDSGPASGFMTEADSDQTHNVVATIPTDNNYSPFWMVNVYDNADFDQVSDLSSATSANILANGVANVNCPIVSVE